MVPFALVSALMKVTIDLTDRSDLEVGERYAKEALMASLAMAKLTQLRRSGRINRQIFEAVRTTIKNEV